MEETQEHSSRYGGCVSRPTGLRRPGVRFYRRSRMENTSVCAVMVTYHPDDGVLDNLAAIRPQVKGLVVVDKGSSKDDRNRWRLAAREMGFTLVENGDNLGIAAALNIGVRRAQSERY